MLKVTCGILQKGDKYFVARRPQGKSMGGYWEFPGGKVEEGEPESTCLYREWKEELDASIIIYHDLEPITYDYGNFQIELYSFLIEVPDGKITLKEHTESGYFSKKELLGMDLTPADRIVVEKYL